MKMNIKYKLSLIIVMLLSTVSCQKSFLSEDPKAIIAPDNLYVSKAGFESGLFGLYNLVRAERKGINGASNDMAITAAVVGVDNAFSLFPAAGAPESVFNDFGLRLNAGDAYINRLWRYLYEVVNTANTIIGRSENPSIKWTEMEKNQIISEARLIRAWAYRHLTYLWGDVPLSLKESDGGSIKTDWERIAVTQVRKAMEEDLLFAEVNLPEVATIEGRVSKVVAQHYLAELYLTTGENQKAKDKALAVVQNRNYRIVTARYGVRRTLAGTPFTDMFIDGNSNRKQGNTELLWLFPNQYLSVGGDVNIMRRWWVNRYNVIRVNNRLPITFSKDNGGRGLGRFGVTKFALSLYQPNDNRGSSFAWRYFWIMNNASSLPAGVKTTTTCASPGYTGSALGDTVKLSIACDEPLPFSAIAQNWPNIRKWDWAPDDIANVQESSNYNDQIYLRLADTYLLLAEAQLKLNDAPGAAITINILRTRANTSQITAAQVTLDFILDERSRELITEEHRRYTLLRTGKWLERTKLYNKYSGPLITARDQLLPIPQPVIDANLNKLMPQNNGY